MEAKGRSKQPLAGIVPGACCGVAACVLMTTETGASLCLLAGKSCRSQYPRASYLMCDCNYFPKKIKVTSSVNLKFPARFCRWIGSFSHQTLEAEQAENAEPVSGGILPPPSGRWRDCPLVLTHATVKVTGQGTAKKGVNLKPSLGLACLIGH